MKKKEYQKYYPLTNKWAASLEELQDLTVHGQNVCELALKRKKKSVLLGIGQHLPMRNCSKCLEISKDDNASLPQFDPNAPKMDLNASDDEK